MRCLNRSAFPQVLIVAGLVACGFGCNTETAPPEAATPQQSAVEEPGALVRSTLHADTAAIEPGTPFRLGVRYAIAPRTHIYWHNPGDSGLPTGIEWELPEDFDIGPPRWPAPIRFVVAELNDTSYGYAKELFLFAEVTPPADLEAGARVTFKASPYWLACMEDGQCIPGGENLELTLPVGAAEPSEDTALFEAAEARVPIPARDIADRIAINAQPGKLDVAGVGPWSIVLKGAAAFPFEGGHWNLVRTQTVDDSGAETAVAFTSTEGTFAGILRLTVRNVDNAAEQRIAVQVGEHPES